jgi:hypothetical protein
MVATGYYGGGTDGWISGVSGVAGAIRFNTAEAWSSTATGTNCVIVLSPPSSFGAAAGATYPALTLNGSTSTLITDTFNINNLTDGTNLLSLNKSSGDVVLSLNQKLATSGNENAVFNFTTQRSADGINYTPTQSGDTIGEFKFNGNANTSTSPGSAGPAASISAIATETWNSGAQGTRFSFSANKTGTTTSYPVISGTPDYIDFAADVTSFKNYDSSVTFATFNSTSATFTKPVVLSGSTSGSVSLSASATGDQLNLKDSGGVALVGSKINYNRVYGQWQYSTTITPAAADTAYVFPIGTPDFNNIASIASTSHIVLGAAGMYNLQFSVQLENTTNAEHVAYIWLRKNGTDIANSTGRVTVIKSGSTIAGWNFVIDSANTTDYYEIAYAVSNTALIFPTYASTAFCPGTATLVTTVTPIGA